MATNKYVHVNTKEKLEALDKTLFTKDFEPKFDLMAFDTETNGLHFYRNVIVGFSISTSSKNGWYIIFADQNPTCVFGSWKTGQKITWSLKKPRDLAPLEREQHRQRIAQAQQEAEQERKRHQQEAARR